MTDTSNLSLTLENIRNKFSNKKRCLKIAHINVENLTVHRESFVSLFQDSGFDIIAITETFLKPEILSLVYNLSGYDFIRHDRLGKEGGGVGLYIKNTFRHKIVATSQSLYCKKPEYLFVEISQGWKLLICVVYRPPKSGYLSEMFDNVANLIPLYENILIIGDFNIDLCTNREFADKVYLINTLDSLSLNILPLGPTFHLPNSDTLLDLMVVNDRQRVVTFGQDSVSGLSYHDLIYVELDLKVNMSKNNDKIVVRDFKNIQVDVLVNECSNISWQELYDHDSIDIKVNILINKLSSLFDKYVPERKVSCNKNACPWINQDIRNLMKNRETLYKRYVRTKDVVIWEQYKLLRNRIKTMLRDARNEHFKGLFEAKRSGKDMWNILKNQGVGKERKKLSEPTVDLNNLNNFFCGIDNNINTDLIDLYTNKRNVDLDDEGFFKFKDVDYEIINKVLNDISSNAVGVDGLQLRFLKLIYNEIKEVLCHVFNFSLTNGVYPSDWKKSIILPLPKISDPTECKHYRPINILCVLSKMLDKLVYLQISSFIEENNILYMYQSGYRSMFSTQTALIRITDDIRLAMDKRRITILMLLDFSRAFDCVNHSLLIAILKSYNLHLSAVKWFSSYLTDRLQRIRTAGGSVSEWMHNPLGVPQGSTLSALLFSLYINRISDCLSHSKSILYADDMQLYLNCDINRLNDTVALVNEDLASLYKWCTDHGLNLNASKCKPMLIATSRYLQNIDLDNVQPIVINNQILKYETSVTNLGLRFTNSLSWTDQVNYVHKKIYQCLYQFKRLCFKPPINVKKQLVVSLVFPYIDYAIAAYCDLNDELTNKLQKAQNSCVRYIFNLRLDEHVTPYYKTLKWLKIKERRELNVLSLTYKVLKYEKPKYLFDNYIYLRNVHLRNTRFGDEILRFPVHRTVIYTKSFHVMSVRLMNSIDHSIKIIVKYESFVKKLKDFLLKRYES